MERIEQFVGETSARIRRLEAHDNLDKGFLETEEAAEFVIEVTNTVTLERDSEKRNLYATILANTARRDINRSFYPTALLGAWSGSGPLHAMYSRPFGVTSIRPSLIRTKWCPASAASIAFRSFALGMKA